MYRYLFIIYLLETIVLSLTFIISLGKITIRVFLIKNNVGDGQISEIIGSNN